MAGERKGKTYEALVYMVLRRLRACRHPRLKGEIHWNVRPEGMSIEPDFLLGRDPGAPGAAILVTHSGSAKESEKKLWRNIGELVEEKTRLVTVPRVYSIAFDSAIKEDLKRLQAQVFDGQLIVGDRSYGTALREWIDTHQGSLPKDGEEKAAAIECCAGQDGQLARLLNQLTGDIDGLLRCARPDLDSHLWQRERMRVRGGAPSARMTFVRRGTSKLLIFEDTETALRLYSGKRVRQGEVPSYAYQLGLAKRGLGRAYPADDEIGSAVTTLGEEKGRYIVRKAPLAQMTGWLRTLRNMPHIEFMGRYVSEHFAEISDPNELHRQLVDLHRNPMALAREYDEIPGNWPPGSVWLLEYLLELVKRARKGASAYGYSQLASDAEVLPGMPPATDRVYRIVLPDWVHRVGHEVMPASVLLGLCRALASHISEIGEQRAAKLVLDLPGSYASNIIETKLCTYRMFEPLWTLIQRGVPGAKQVSVRPCFAEAAGISGQAGKTTVAWVRGTLINWQSCSDAGRDHKKKELCGRAVGLRYHWDAERKEFIPRPGVKKMVLVLDGTWRQHDLDALVRAGWDEIYYPDEMEKLAATIE